ncbi:MAG: glycosyltransferase family 2 protein [Nitrososphaera sp.]|nr:glycosyltransferase family 2 protein [Nitrososphaera sp.]
MTIIFWIAFGILIYIYIGYPVLVWILAGLFGRNPECRDFTPQVSLVIPAKNEEALIEEKLRNSLGLDYPKDRLEIIVASNGSTDNTEAIVERWSSQGVKLESVKEAIGKSAMLTRTIPLAQGNIIVLSDADTQLEPDAVRVLMRAFADPRVGCVCGTYGVMRADNLRAQGEGLYWKYESFLRSQESRLFSWFGAHGPFYAIRKELFRALDPSWINDDYLIPMHIVDQGYRVVYESGARSWEHEKATASLDGEFARRRRIAAGNCQQTVRLAHLLNPLRGWVFFCFFSHKVLRTLAPLFMLLLLFSSFGLSAPWSVVFLGLQALFYGSAYIGYLCLRRGLSIRWLAPSLYFCLGNLAMLAGLLNYCFNRRTLSWERVR